MNIIEKTFRSAKGRKIIILSFIAAAFLIGNCQSAEWKDWELGGELGLAYGKGGKSGKIMGPGLMVTGVKTIGQKTMEIGMGYFYGSEITINYPKSDIDPDFFDDEEMDLYDDLLAGAEQDVKIRISVIPMTVNFLYKVYSSFYVGGGLGLYHVFYKEEPLGDYRANVDSAKGEIVKSPSTTAIGFQGLVGVQVFPMSEKWNWFIGLKPFVTTAGGTSGSLMGITFGGKVRYNW
ncbi:MAG: hypothetical protein ABIH89_03980 [Elusimicrobiota bacterium]